MVPGVPGVPYDPRLKRESLMKRCTIRLTAESSSACR